MEYKRCQNTVIVRLDPGDEIVAELRKIAEAEKITFAAVSGLGAVGYMKAGCYSRTEEVYKSYEKTGDMEIVSLTGNVNTMDGETYLHLHISVADGSGSVFGGHLSEAVISCTAEIVLSCVPTSVDRSRDEATGLNLFDFNKEA